MADDSVQVKFGADTGDVNAGVDEVKSKISELSDSVPELVENFKSVGEALLAAFEVEKVVEFIGKMTEMGEQIERTAKMTGLSTDQVQQFQYAVRITGGDAESAGVSLSRFERNISEAAAGSGAAAKAFQALGISQEQLKSGDVNAILGDIAEKFSQTADGANKTAIAIALFGRAGAGLIPVFDKGRDGINELNGKLEDLGGRLAPEVVAKLTEMKEASTNLSVAWQGLGADLVTTFAGSALTNATASFLEFLHNALDATNKLLDRLDLYGDKVSDANYNGFASTDRPDTVDYAVFANSGGPKFGPQQQTPQEQNPLPNLPALGNPTPATPAGPDTTGDAAFLDTVRQHLDDLKEIEEENKKITAEYTKDWNSAFDVVDKSLDSMLQGVLMGTQSVSQAASRFFDNMALVAIEDIAKIMLKVAALQAMEAFGGSPTSGATGALANMVPSALGGNETKDSIDILVTALGLNTAAQTTQVGTNTVQTITNTAAITANTAAVASSGSSSGISGFLKSILPSYDVGSWNIPSNQLAMIHAGEMIIPAQQANAIRSGSGSIGGAGGGAGGDMYSINISAIDTQSGVSFLKNNIATISKALSSQMRNNNGLNTRPTS